ncbi:hypothetical protein T10_1517 [Trichinella papuae]|uniref:Uncharacterized protein n=1 Tax=Trichinella papuae TaxID=268474 RepID=A0A0V1M5H9_9BILA|nr:hypothetical protein T10_1517 [Trichinella papuae]
MAVVPKLHPLPNRSGSMSLVYEGRAYKLRHTLVNKTNIGFAQKYALIIQCVSFLILVYDKTGCGGAIWTNLVVTSVIKHYDHIESCPVDEHLAYNITVDSSHANLGYGWYFQGCTTMVSTTVYHPCLCGG